MIGQLPSREVLLSQVLGTIAAPLQALLYLLEQKSKQTVEAK
jgi:ribosomal protein L10